jgi:uncharacterized membrane protein YkoI
MKKILILLLLAGIITAITTTGMADSDRDEVRYRDRDDHDTALELKESENILPLEEIIGKAKSIHPGRILETELERKGKAYVYELEILDQMGQVWEMKYDAKTGELIKDKQDD